MDDVDDDGGEEEEEDEHRSLACSASVRPPTKPPPAPLPGAGCRPVSYITLCQLLAACRWGHNLAMQLDSTYNWPRTECSSLIN
ncbi:unnamed protein product [Pleuronectes platessa]|uniref:Uncharacterized protein n=1 Tax=Pleuronectes platessa TaxID=8262 RepID=A0A9N7YCI5_PLEPL|nr:unnamed protein product [Pleuronectes platessa]